MKKYLTIFAYVVLFACAKSPEFKFKKLTFGEALKRAGAENKQVLLDFYSPT